MKLVHSLVALAITPLLVGPALANPRVCRTCAPPVKVIRKAVKVPVIVKQNFREKLTVIEKPVFVREAVSYLATILPASTYNIQTTVNTPPAQQLGFQVGVAQFGAYQGQAVYQQPQAYAAPQAVQAAPQDALAAALEKINQRLCNLEERGGGVGAVQTGAGIPRALATKCAVCHSATAAATKGGGFELFSKGTLAQLSERDLRQIAGHVYAGTMPPKGNSAGVAPLTDAEVAEVMDWIARQK